VSFRQAAERRASWIEKTCWVCAALFCSLYAVSISAHQLAMKQTGAEGSVKGQKTSASTSGVTGTLRIPSLQLTAPMFAGCSLINLEKGACHLEGSANFGGLGNAAVAAHRDKDFRPLERVRNGMDILVSDGGQEYLYVVDSHEIVSPEDIQVLEIHDRPELTLITCYPFHYIGSAPKRFIVHAHLEIRIATATG